MVDGKSLSAHFRSARHRDDPMKWCRRAEGSKMTDVKNMTERESYIIAQALYEFIRLEQSKPINERRETQKPYCTRGSTTNWRF